MNNRAARRVLLIVENLSVPFDRRVWKECQALREAGYQVSAISPMGIGVDSRWHETVEGVSIYRYPSPQSNGGFVSYILEYAVAVLMSFLLTAVVFLREGFEAIQICNPPDLLILSVAPFKLFGKTIIFDQHDITPDIYQAQKGKPPENFVVRTLFFFERLTYSMSDVVMVVNESCRKLATGRGGIHDDDVFVVRNGPSLQSIKEARVNPALKKGKKHLLTYVGMMGPQEGIDVMLRIIQALTELRDDFHTAIIGGGTVLDQMKQYAVELGIGDRVTFAGYVNHTQSMDSIASADVCLCPDPKTPLNDKCSMVKAVEYMSIGRPFVAFDLEEVRLSAGDAALYAMPNSEKDFAAKIDYLLKNEGLRIEMGQRGRERVRQKLTWEHSKSALYAAYDRAFEKKGLARWEKRQNEDRNGTALLTELNTVLANFLEHTRCPETLVGSLLRQKAASPARETPAKAHDPRTVRDDFAGRLLKFGYSPAATPKDVNKLIAALTANANNVTAETLADVDAAIDFFRFEQYIDNSISEENLSGLKNLVRQGYYTLRPLFPVAFRKYLQRAALQGWDRLPFPAWPVDFTVEELIDTIWRALLQSGSHNELPFIWFWPDGHPSACIMTHDVETGAGRDFCATMMSMEKRHGITSAFEIVPEVRYEVSEPFLEEIREGGCEVCIQGLNHDGRLFVSDSIFFERAPKINAYAKNWRALGFRSPVLYRNLDWFNALKFSYDMSIPNVGRLDPQRGGCCTVMPYFIGDMLELPLTTIQDYSLFNILQDRSLDLWNEQISAIHQRNGLISFIIHPDYVNEKWSSDLFEALLGRLDELRSRDGVWMTLPREVDAWWRARREMRLADAGGGRWKIIGPQAERARVAYASLKNGAVVYRLEETAVAAS